MILHFLVCIALESRFSRWRGQDRNAAVCLEYNFHNSSSALCLREMWSECGKWLARSCWTKLETRLKCSRPARINWPAAAAQRELVSIVGQEVSADERWKAAAEETKRMDIVIRRLPNVHYQMIYNSLSQKLLPPSEFAAGQRKSKRASVQQLA